MGKYDALGVFLRRCKVRNDAEGVDQAGTARAGDGRHRSDSGQAAIAMVAVPV